MKRLISIFLVMLITLSFSSCMKNETSTDEKGEQEANIAENEKIAFKVLENDKVKSIVTNLDVMEVTDVLNDIKDIDLYFEPANLVKSEDGAEFENDVKTATGLEAKVKYFVDSGDNRVVVIETNKYKLAANYLNDIDPYGIGDANITIFSQSTKSPFESSVAYYYDNGIATFDNAIYLENGAYQRYSYYVDQDEKPFENIDVLVSGDTPAISKDIIKAVQSNINYDSLSILIDNRDEWFFDGNNWFVKATLGIFMNNKENAEIYNAKNNLNGKVIEDGVIVIEVKDVVLPITLDAVLKDGKLPSFITEEHDNLFYSTITLDSNGMIKELVPTSVTK